MTALATYIRTKTYSTGSCKMFYSSWYSTSVAYSLVPGLLSRETLGIEGNYHRKCAVVIAVVSQ